MISFKKQKKMGKKTNFLSRKNLINLIKDQRKAQVAVFIVIALMILIVLILLFFRRDIYTVMSGEKSPVEKIKDCTRTYTQEALDIISERGGLSEPDFYFMYEGQKLEYLCYTEEYYKPCIMQRPFLKQGIEKEMEKYIIPKVRGCMAGVKTDLEKGGYSVTLGNVDVDIELVPSNIIINIESEFTMSKGGVESYKSIKTDMRSKLYDLLMIAGSISNMEARYGDTESIVYMTYYPTIKVEKKKQGDGTTVYILTDKITQDKYMFATKGGFMPAGVTGK